jgi:hypothetical protein
MAYCDHRDRDAAPAELRFDPNLTLRSDKDLGRQLGLGHAAAAGHQAMRMAMLANLGLALMHGPNVGIFYSRDVAHYARVRRWVPPAYSRRNVVTVVDELVAARIIRHEQVSPSPHNTRRSAVYPLIALPDLGVAIVSQLAHHVRDPIILRDVEGRLQPFRSTAMTRRLRDDVLAQNEVLRRIKITLHDPAWTRDEHGLHRHGSGRILDPSRVELHRVFNNGDWAQGGRWYGGWWQQLPAAGRARLQINGAAVCEEDYAACHLRLMGAIAQVPLPDGDPYRIAAVEEAMQDTAAARQLSKLALQVLVNAATHQAAHGAINAAIAEIGAAERVTATQLVRAIKVNFRAFRGLWHSGLGLRLQRLDSDIAADVMRQLRARSVPVLSVHDSFIVPVQSRSLLREAMDRAFRAGLDNASKLRLS